MKLILHSQLTAPDLKRIIHIKKVHWDYSIYEHENWIRKNIKEDDIHVLMIEDEVLVGYLNLIKTEVILNGLPQSFLGIGNVCTLRKGYSYGEKLIVKTQKYLLENNFKGILFCKDKLVGFYSKYGWKLVAKNKIISENYNIVNIMFYNVDAQIETVDYKERNF